MLISQAERKHQVREQLTTLVREKSSFDLARAALLLAAEEYVLLDVEAQLARLAALGREAAQRVESLDNTFARLDALRVFLFEHLRFRGNQVNYEDPRNSFLNEVLDRRLGIPITLTIVFTEVARACGFETRGIGLPGHFIAGVVHDGRSLLVDPFHGGHVITEEDCRQLVARSTGRPSLFQREQLDGSTDRAALQRMLLNLKRVYLAREDYARALACVERLLLLEPEDPRETRDRGFLLAHLGRPGDALQNLETYLAMNPAAPDAASVRGRMAWLKRRLSEAN